MSVTCTGSRRSTNIDPTDPKGSPPKYGWRNDGLPDFGLPFPSGLAMMRQILAVPNVLNRLPGWLQAALRDRYLWGMAIVALFVNLGLFAFLLLVSNQLPPLVPLHFDAAAQPDRIEDKSALYSLPQIGLIMLAADFFLGAAFYRREPLASYLLGGIAIAAQFLLWFAAVSIVRAVLS